MRRRLKACKAFPFALTVAYGRHEGGVKGVSGFPDFTFKMVLFPYFKSDSFRVAGLRMLDGPGSYIK